MRRVLLPAAVLFTAILLTITGCSSPADTPAASPTVTSSSPAATTSVPAATTPVSATTPAAPATTTPAVPQPVPSQLDRTILVDYSPTFVQQGGKGLYLVLNVEIVNNGYQNFISAPGEFSVIVSGIPRPCDTSLSNLKTLNMTPGTRLLGKLAFPVPDNTEAVGWTLWHAQQNDTFDFVFREQPRQATSGR